ncbi:unnamed protein product [Rotaria sp. Silwood1]|nr:unnamed protein product [Rotaria sp. Silwood1]
MSIIRDNRGIRSSSFRNLDRSQSTQSYERFMNRPLILKARHTTSSTNHANDRTSHQTDRSRSNSSAIRYRENQDYHSNIGDSERRPSFNEQTPYSSSNNINRRYYGKRDSTTFKARFDSPPIKRPRLPPVSYSALIKLVDKSSDEILIEMLHPNFQLNKFLNDKRMKERYDWIHSMTILLEKITKCIGSNDHIRNVFEQLPDTLYLEGVYDEVPKVDPNTNQLRFNFIELFLKVSNTFLVMIPYSADVLTKIFERIELQFSKIKYESRV